MSDSGFRCRPLALGRPTMFAALLAAGAVTPVHAQVSFATLNYGTTGTFLTGIRGDTIVGNYVIHGGTGGLLYSLSSGKWSPLPVATASGANFPGAVGSSPYGPSFGSQDGILRAVGSYKTQASSPYDRSYLYDAAAVPGRHIRLLDYPAPSGAQVLNTIAHSTFGNQVVGNYDTSLKTGNAFNYNIRTGTYTTHNMPGAVSTTAYGIYGDKVAGGYAMAGSGGGIGFEHGYIYDQSAGTWTTYDHPGAIFTHFEGITGAGRSGEYNMVANWGAPDGTLHAAILHLGSNGEQTWFEIPARGAVSFSANSAYADKAIGIYVGADGIPNGYLLTIPEMYNPIRNFGRLLSTRNFTPALFGRNGDDIVNDGTIRTTGVRSAGIRSDTYGVVTNNGLISVTGMRSAAVEMHGRYGTLLNAGTIKAAPSAFAIRTGLTASGALVVNSGVVDGRVLALSGREGRFENSGWLGISSPGAGAAHVISGVFAQTDRGTLALRTGPTSSDRLLVGGAARLAGTALSIIQPGGLLNSYRIVTVTGGYTGKFGALETIGLPTFMTASLAYAPKTVTLALTSAIADVGGLTPNQASVGSALDTQFNQGSLQPGLSPVFGLSEGELPNALRALSGEVHSALPSTLYTESGLAREAILERLRGSVASAPLVGDAQNPPTAGSGAFSVWGQGIGAWGRSGSDGNSATLERQTGGFILGADVLAPAAMLPSGIRLGAAGGYLTTEVNVVRALAQGTTSSVFGALYAGTTIGSLRLSTGALYMGSQFDASRTIQAGAYSGNTGSKQDASSIQAFGEVGYTLLAGQGTLGGSNYVASVEPFVNAAAIRLRTDDFSENGGAASLVGFGRSYDIGVATVGARLRMGFGPLAPLGQNGGVTEVFALRASLGWRGAFGDVEPAALLAFRSSLAPVSLSAFDVASVPIDRGAVIADVGLDWQVASAVTLGVSYAVQAGSNAIDQALRGRFEARF